MSDTEDVLENFLQEDPSEGVVIEEALEEMALNTPTSSGPYDRKLPTPEKLLKEILDHRGWNLREGQATMVTEVSETVSSTDWNRGAVIDAPVGTGKSLGYLIGALPSNHRIVICTSTKALQDQLVRSELPRLASDLKSLYDYDLTYSVLKGRSNYLCMNAAKQYVSGQSLDEDEDATLFGEDLDEATKTVSILAVEGLIERTQAAMDNGIITDLDCSDGLGQLPSQISSSISSSRKCSARSEPWTEELDEDEAADLGLNDPRVPRPLQDIACQSVCAYRRAYADGMKADIVVMNTSLLAAELIKSKALVNIPTVPQQLLEAGVIIVDEAHHLDRILTDALRLKLDMGDLYEHAEKWFRKLAVRRKDMEDRINSWKIVMDSHQEKIEEIVDETRPSRVLKVLSRELFAMSEELEQLTIGLETPVPSIDEPIIKSIKRIVRNISEDILIPIREVASSIMEKTTNENGKLEDVYDVTFEGGNAEQYLLINATPLDLSFVRGDLATVVGQQNPYFASSGINYTATLGGALILCSGTITDEAMKTIGMNEGHYRRVPSPFDHARSRLLIPTSLGEPSSAAWSDEAWGIARKTILAAGGRTLFLTTSHRNLTMFKEMAFADPEIKELGIVYQGMGTRQEIIDRFADQESSILIGTTSFWEGIDVPGPALSQVIMDKVMFPMRDDPIFSARRKFVEKHHPGEAFMKVDVNHAGIMLAQGAGRLIRAESDMGGIVILDPRLMGKYYGSEALKLLPAETKLTTSVEDYLKWMEFVRESIGNPDAEIPEVDPRVYRDVRQKRPRRGRRNG